MNERHNFSDKYNTKKTALIGALNDEAFLGGQKQSIGHIPQRILCIAAVAVLLTVSVCAAVHLVDFSLFEDGNEAHINAGLTGPADTSEPLRSWNSDEGEISIRLDFAYMPDDMTEDMTANGKWGGDDVSRAITFSGFDLRRSDLDSVIGGVESTEQITVGEHKAYFIRSASEIALYDKTAFVLFEEEQLVIKAYVTYGIAEDELKAILSGMSIEETDDVSLALPITNETGSDNIDIPDVMVVEKEKIYYNDLKKIGDTAEYAFGPEGEAPWIKYGITVEGFEIRDSFAGLSASAIERKDIVEKFTDDEGNLIPYKRTEIIRGDGVNTFGSFGETVEMTKRLVLVTVRIEDFYSNAGESPQLYLRSYSLYGLEKDENGLVKNYGRMGDWAIDSTPGTYSECNEVVYNEHLGGDLYRIGYILDTDELGGELLFSGFTPKIHYVLK